MCGVTDENGLSGRPNVQRLNISDPPYFMGLIITS